MPVEEDYGRRQTQQSSQNASQQQQQQSSTSPPVVPSNHCPNIACGADHRYASDKNLLDPSANNLDRSYSTSTDRFHSERSNSDRLPSGERYQAVCERYPLGERPQTSVSSERLLIGKDQPPIDYHNHYTIQTRYPERYTPDRYHSQNTLQYATRTATPTYLETKEKSERYHYDHYARKKYQRYDQPYFPAIPCPERFATQQFHMEPPSPAPASDRFVPPPPLSPDDSAPNNTFPSPTTDRFVPPPPLTPSPTDHYSPKKQRYERYDRYHQQPDRFKERTYYYDRYVSNERYVPPHAHMPVERYVPQDQYYQNYQTYYTKIGSTSSTDPYSRRDLAYHHRVPLPYPSNQYQRVQRYMGTPNRGKCCQYDGYQLSKSSPGSSSSSSVTSSQGKVEHQKDGGMVEHHQCQSYAYQQQGQGQGQVEEKGVQCGSKECFVSPSLRKQQVQVVQQQQCRHGGCSSPGVEYVGASGGRHVCATPPPRGSSSNDGSLCGENCCNGGGRRAQTSLTVAVWRSTPPQQQQQPSPIPPKQPTPPLAPHHVRIKTPIDDAAPPTSDPPLDPSDLRHPPPHPHSSPIYHQRAISLPAAVARPAPNTAPPPARLQYTQSERLPHRPPLNRSESRRDAIRNYLRRETATFFGVEAANEERQQRRWMDRRMRMASRVYGPLKDEYRAHMDAGGMARQVGAAEVGGQMQAERPDVLPGGSDLTDADVGGGKKMGLRRKDSVARMTLDGLSYVVNTITRHRPRRWSQESEQSSRTFPPDSPQNFCNIDEDSFFQKPSPDAASSSSSSLRPIIDESADAIDRGGEHGALQRLTAATHPRPASTGWKRDSHVVLRRHRDDMSRSMVTGSRVDPTLLDNVHDNSDRRQYGMGWLGKAFGRSMRKSMIHNVKIKEQLDDMEDHRPMFTYWVTTVQILVLIISLICYGFGSVGIDLQTRSGQVLVTSLSLQQVDYLEPANFWLGPRAGDLIHLGAKFAPCMRMDDKIKQQIEQIRTKERETACCIRNDDSGCVQSSQADCSKVISTWKKWSTGDSDLGGHISGSVCGLDPLFCGAPASGHPYKWPDDITKWPICRKTNSQFSTLKHNDKNAEHMVCDIIGHPCCIGIHAQCSITTKEYCDFVHGTFHDEASLCSQVSCLNDVCGMLPFYYPETPDQFYRLWTSLFLHAGIIQLIITVLIQYFLMRDLEKLTGSLRIAIIYIGSGVAGNLASAIFVSYRADVGPSGSQFGLLACSIVEILNAWPMLKNPSRALSKVLCITFGLFILGLLPWVDNYAHLFGFVFGFLLSYAHLPFISFGSYDRHKKIALIWVCLLSAGFLFICLILLFYIIPVYDCKICSYFNCIPLTNEFCASQNINFKRAVPMV